MKANEFQCVMCGGIFEKGWSEEEARKELEENFGDLASASCEQVCDPCYQKIKPSEHPKELKEAMEEFYAWMHTLYQ